MIRVCDDKLGQSGQYSVPSSTDHHRKVLVSPTCGAERRPCRAFRAGFEKSCASVYSQWDAEFLPQGEKSR